MRQKQEPCTLVHTWCIENNHVAYITGKHTTHPPQIADRTDKVRQTIKPVSVTSLRTVGMPYARSDSTGRVIYERTQTLSTQASPLSVTDQSSVVHA